jgi:hypothetical protein
MAHVLNKSIHGINTLIDDIKFNCEVSDAKYWGHFSICGLLMRLRALKDKRAYKIRHRQLIAQRK